MPTTHDTREEAAVAPRKSRRRAWTSAVGAVAVAVSALVMTSATVVQAADPATVCNGGDGRRPDAGSGTYGQVNSAAIPGGGGTLYLFYNNTTGYNCAVTINAGVGTTYMDVGLRQTGNNGTAQWNSGQFGQYAGPVYVSARGICVDTTGAVGDQSTALIGTNCGS
ncbi:spore-associated protein [Nocardiopsis sp. NPDC050513]|uniref:spore-associated protein n=1 Tax=Nocardiopsis sp. NPDC050513 TaxID=3364338 RepID=UPI00379F0BDA